VDIAAELRALAGRVPDDVHPAAAIARQRAAGAAGAAAGALGADPTVAERAQRDLDLLGELLRRAGPLARQAGHVLEHQRLTAAGQDAGRLGRVNPQAPEELDWVSRRCTVIAERITAAVLPDWDTPRRWRELSARRMPGEHELAEIADLVRRAVAPALDLPCPDPGAVRLAAIADQIAPQAGRCAAPGCGRELQAAPTGRRRRYCGPACRQRARRRRLGLAEALPAGCRFSPHLGCLPGGLGRHGERLRAGGWRTGGGSTPLAALYSLTGAC
jgi:hypothetical protein